MSAATAAQAPDSADLSPTSSSHDTIISPLQQESQEIFRFRDLPLELRLKIYNLLLPPRSHTIATQIPHNGFFYNTSTIPLHFISSFYPFGTSPPQDPTTQNQATYKVLNRNFRTDFPEPSLEVQILRVCRQIKEDAEPVLYGNPKTEWDFGFYFEAVDAFFSDRSEVARGFVRHVKVAREICDGMAAGTVEYAWEKFCKYIGTEMPGLRTVDLTIWSSSGSTTEFPLLGGEGEDTKEMESRWKDWGFVKGLMGLGELRRARVTWWGFDGKGQERGQGQGFGSWLARRMVGDKVVREKMVSEGVVKEGIVVLSGGGGHRGTL
jgi:hypothetical protein